MKGAGRTGRYLRELRLNKRVSIRELGKTVNMSYSHLAQIERGERGIRPRQLWDIVSTLGGDFYYALQLLCLDDGVPPEALGIEPERRST